MRVIHEAAARELSRFMLTTLDETAEWAAQMTLCRRKGVAAVMIHADHRGRVAILGRAHNGTWLSRDMCTNEVGSCGCAHAEPKVLAHVPTGFMVEGVAIMLTTYSPCANCAHAIVQSGAVRAVVYREVTEHDERGLTILHRNGIGLLNAADLRQHVANDITGPGASTYATIKEWLLPD